MSLVVESIQAILATGGAGYLGKNNEESLFVFLTQNLRRDHFLTRLVSRCLTRHVCQHCPA
jgi:hypothetical protein